MKCNTPSCVMVRPVRGSESQSLSGAHIQFARHFVAFSLRDFAHGHSFWEVPPKQSVEVLVGAPLPRVIRGGEVALDRVHLLDGLVVMELGAVVERDRLEPLAVLRDRHHRRFVDLGHRAARKLLDDGQARLALDQRQHTVVLVGADHGVAFPVPDAQPRRHFLGALTDVPLARQNAPVIDAAVTLARELRDDPRVLPQRASELAVTQDVAVDRAVAEVQLCAHAQHTCDLLGAAQFKTMLEKRRQWAEHEGLSPDAIERMFSDLVNHFIEEEMQRWQSTYPAAPLSCQPTEGPP